MSVSRFINIHKLRCSIIHSYLYYTILVFVKGKQRRNYAVHYKTVVKANRVENAPVI